MIEYYIEKHLKEKALALHQRMKDSVSVFHTTLWSFLSRFPSFTDHSMLHSMDVLEFCNEIIGAGQIHALNAAECYVLIMSCYMHDTGMGISDRDYQEFSKEIDFGDYSEGIPAFLCVLFMVCAYSISDGIMMGVLSYVVICTATGKIRKVNRMTWVLAALFIVRIVMKALV